MKRSFFQRKQKSKSSGIKRRAFIGMGLSGVAGITLPAFQATGKSKNLLSGNRVVIDKQQYWKRTEKFEEKMELLQQAWASKNFRLVRALTDSLRNTAVQAQVEEEVTPVPVSGAAQFAETSTLPDPWKQWAKGWRYFKTLTVKELLGMKRTNEPIEITLSFPAEQVVLLSREIRVARYTNGKIQELTSQVFGEVVRNKERVCQLAFLLDSLASEEQQIIIFYGNPTAELPVYPSDLLTTGTGFGLTIENEHYKVMLSRQTGQIERMILKREHGMELYSGGQGHGEPAGIDWAHDYTSEDHFQKFRISLWEECPDYEIIRGPVCTIVRRWGFPYSPLHPVFSPSQLNIDIEYRFYAGLPYFIKNGQMTAIKDFGAAAVRDDEWVFTGQSFTDVLWMDADGKLKTGAVPPEHQSHLWGIGFYNKDTQDCFMGVFLKHSTDAPGEISHSGSPTLHYKWHGQLWSRYPVSAVRMKRGTVLLEKNAYSVFPFTPAEGPEKIESLRKTLLNPLAVSSDKLKPSKLETKGPTGNLARSGEADDAPISKKLIWQALQLCKDPQLYKSDVSIVDLGFVYDVRVRGDVVTVVLAMPHRGRPLGSYFDYGSNSVHGTTSHNIPDALRAVPGVKKVIVEQTWYPAWNSNFITEDGRQKLELD